MNPETLQVIETIGGFAVAIAVLLLTLYLFAVGRIVSANRFTDRLEKLISDLEYLVRKLKEGE